MANTIIGEREKVLFAQEAYWSNWSHKVCVNRLIKMLGSFLRFLVVYFGDLYLLAGITAVSFAIINERYYQLSEVFME